jgi:hypothetical protein
MRHVTTVTVLVALITGSVQATVRLVPEDYGTIQAAFQVSSAFDTVSLAAGTYGGDATSSIPLSLMGREPVPSTTVSGTITINAGSDFSNACQIEGLVFSRTDGRQLECQDGWYIVRRNVFDSTHTLGPAIVYFPDNVVGTFENNYMRHNGWGLIAYGSTALLVRNNVFRDCAGSGITTLSNLSCTFIYNCFYNNARDFFGDGPDEGNIFTDPLINGFTFMPQTGSPCIDAGDPASPLDPDGSRADIGILSTIGQGGVDTVFVDQVYATPGDTVVLRVTLSNPATAVAGMTIPLQYVGTGITLLSVTHVDRGLAFDFPTDLIDNVQQSVLLGYVSLDTLLEPGKGMLAELTFAVDTAAPEQTVVVDTTMIPPSNTLAIVDAVSVSTIPEFVPGVITVLQCLVDLTGDVQEDGQIDIVDIVYLVSYLFRAGPAPLPVPISADVQCDGNVTVADVVYLVNYVLKAGAAPCDVCD